MMRHYIEPVGWLLACLLFVAALTFAVAPLGMDGGRSAQQAAFDGKVTEPVRK